MSVRSRRTSPPGGVSPGASRWSAAVAPEGPPLTATATTALAPRASTDAADAILFRLSFRNGAPFAADFAWVGPLTGNHCGPAESADHEMPANRGPLRVRCNCDRVA